MVGTPGRGWDDRSARNPRAQALNWTEFMSKTPLSPEVQRDIVRIQEAKVDYMPGLSSEEKKDRLSQMSYRDFLLTVVNADPGVIPFYQRRTEGEWGVGIDAEPALDCWALGLPGFQGMRLKAGAGAAHELFRGGLRKRWLVSFPLPRRERLHRPVTGAGFDSGGCSGPYGRRCGYSESRLQPLGSARCSHKTSSEQHGGSRAQCRARLPKQMAWR